MLVDGVDVLPQHFIAQMWLLSGVAVSGGGEAVQDMFFGRIEADLVVLIFKLLVDGLAVAH